MQRIRSVVLSLIVLSAAAGCASSPRIGDVAPIPRLPPLQEGVAVYGMAAAEPAQTEVPQSERLLIWSARMNIEVRDLQQAVEKVAGMTAQQGGYIEQRSDHGESSASLTLRIPSDAFQPALTDLAAIGRVTQQSVTGKDVTEEYIDIEARLANKVVLRDRLQQLLDRATEISDLLAIETQLNRVQADIDSMEGRIRSLRGQIDYTTIHVRLESETRLGPLGYFFKGLWWGVEKLFVIRK